MQALTEAVIRSSFQGCTAGERKRLRVPDLQTVSWGNLDFFSWLDRADAQTGYLVYADEHGEVAGLVLRAVKPAGSATRHSMCDLCRTIHAQGGVALFTTPQWNESGKNGSTVGNYLCADLACPLYIRRLKWPGVVQIPSLRSLADRSADLRANVAALIERARS